MKHSSSLLLTIGIIFVFTLIVYISDIYIGDANLKTDKTGNLLLGKNGTGYFDRDSKICIGSTLIKVDSRIEATNTGSDVIEITTDKSNYKMLLGTNGTGYFDRDSKIRIGDTMIIVGKRIEITNTGPEIIKITYADAI